jgi:hypothetical protein
LIPRIVVVLVRLRCEQRAVLRAVRREAHVGRVQRHECRAPRDMTPIHQRDVRAALTQWPLRVIAADAEGWFKVPIRGRTARVGS